MKHNKKDENAISRAELTKKEEQLLEAVAGNDVLVFGFTVDAVGGFLH
ncbi:hypothetical protein [Bacillus massilinigeriensis]|nr:hypothetical protein [Bacillus mediterraneensis]